MQKITLKQVKAAARRLYKVGRLMAQHPKPDARNCVYDYDGHHCGIGAAMNKATIKSVHAAGYNNSSITRLIDAKIVEINPAERLAIADVQGFHDAWAQQSRDFGGSDYRTRRARAAFLRAIAA